MFHKLSILFFQVRAILQILRRFNWTWFGLLISDDDYGLHAARSFQSGLTQSGGGCLAYLEVLPWVNDVAELQRIVSIMKKSTSNVVIVFAHPSNMLNLMEEVGYSRNSDLVQMFFLFMFDIACNIINLVVSI